MPSQPKNKKRNEDKYSIHERDNKVSLQNRVEADAFLAAIVESSDDAIISESLDGIITSWNKGAERLFGYRADEILGKPITTIFPPDRLGEEITILEQIRRGDRVNHFETVRRRKDGTYVDISLTVSPIKGNGGKIIGASKIARDLSEHNQAKETLRSEQRLRLILEAAPNGMVMVDAQGKIVMVNAQMERLFGYTRMEMLNQPIEMLIPERYRAGHPKLREDYSHSPSVRAMGHGRDLFARRKDGTEFLVEVGLNPADTPDGKVILAAVIDITARKEIEEALAKSAAQFRLVVESAPNGMVMVDESGRIVMANSQMEKLFGYERAEMVGQPIEMLLPERYRAGHPGQRAGFFHSPATRSMGHGRDLFARRKDGTEFPVEVGLNPAETATGTVVLAAVIDITQRKAMEAELAKAHADLSDRADNLEKMVDERTAHLQSTIAELEGVSYSLSHDMRAPLRTIQSFSQIVLEESREKLGSAEKDLLKKVISAAGRLDRLIQDVLIYSKVARESIELENLNIEELLRQIIYERPDLQPPKAQIEIQSPLPPVRGHEAYLTQCITNLLDNAAKFVPSERQPRIRIWHEDFDGRMRLWFEDNGIGIAKEAQERVFGMFQRVHGETVYPGTGIGLTIVRKAVERMDGRVGVESEPGKGSRFWLELLRGS